MLARKLPANMLPKLLRPAPPLYANANISAGVMQFLDGRMKVGDVIPTQTVYDGLRTQYQASSYDLTNAKISRSLDKSRYVVYPYGPAGSRVRAIERIA
jgi:hypothetical protein